MWVAFAVQKLLKFFQQKNIRILYIESAKTVNEMTLNELVKLTMLWTTGPRHKWVNLFFSVGHKKDTWMAVDPNTGTKLQTLTMDGAQNTCPTTHDNTIFIGRTGEGSMLTKLIPHLIRNYKMMYLKKDTFSDKKFQCFFLFFHNKTSTAQSSFICQSIRRLQDWQAPAGTTLFSTEFFF